MVWIGVGDNDGATLERGDRAMTTQTPTRTQVQAARIRHAASFIGWDASELSRRTEQIDERVGYRVINHIWSDSRIKNVDDYILDAIGKATGQTIEYLWGHPAETFNEPAAWKARGFDTLNREMGLYRESDSRTLFDFMDEDGDTYVDLTELEKIPA